MFIRRLNISKKRSFFLFGARATGKSSLLQRMFAPDESVVIDLLEPARYSELLAYPERLEPLVVAATQKKQFVVIDEVQRVPALLDIAHRYIQSHGALFGLTGSSARKLKRGSANLLAGRASVYRLYPLLWSELGDAFDLSNAIEWGTLPEVCTIAEPSERQRLLQAYAETYLQEEIVAEQIVRRLPPFVRFLHVAAQMNGRIVNASAIGADIQANPSNVRGYFDVLEDTLLGFRLEPYHASIRKRQRQSPKFYWFDTGVVRSLQRQLDVKVSPSTSEYGMLFETFIINQIRTGLDYVGRQYSLSYLLTKDDAEIDLIIERAGLSTLCIEIKSGSSVRQEQLRNLRELSKSIPNSQALCLYNGRDELVHENVEILPWQTAMRRYQLVPE